ncbi:Ig-like domain-containing protein [Leeuwenhoekiella polynyae]|uniref:Endonuclease I n=1 Tax=Leeuwenhoekiella polynyae TaxID=1550906 RepID=A0A4Q0P8M7_9FLAO|nr:Ig-like domain-containing protein [Leeuwenhoekiella polynyae]RXG23027.1 endonuclease I [Leeuwenhoekiella polynyae]
MKKINLKRNAVRFFNTAFVLLLLSCSGGDDSPETPDPETEVDKPVAQADSYTTGENESITFDDLLDNDTIFDFGRVSEIDKESSKGGTILDNRDGSFTYTPPSNFTGEDTFEYTLCDALTPVNCSSTTVTVTVTGSDPIAVADSYEVKENSFFKINNYLQNDELLDNAVVTELDLTGTNGSAVLNEDGSILYTASNGYAGEDTFTYTICDDDETPVCSTATITITVIDEGTPVAVDDEFVFRQENQTLTLEGFTDNDDLIDDAVVTEISYSGSGSATLNEDGTITYTSSNDFIGEETIVYTLCDDDEAPSCVTATITIKLVDGLDVNIPAVLEYYYGDLALTTDEDLNFTVLRTLTQGMHTTILTYFERHEYLYDADADLDNPANVILMYTGESRDRREYTSGSNSYSPQTFNTEHIFPQSRLATANAVTDLHHLRSTDDAINSLRLNYPYTDGSGEYALVNGNSWFPGDEWKGDVARMVLYLNIRYGEDYTKIGTLDLFLKWNREDPVSDFERQRNGVIEGAQGVRNPFIDNPYLATLIWGGTAAENTWE